MAHTFHDHLSLYANSYLSHNHTNDFNLSPLTPSFPDTMHNNPHFFLAFRNNNISAQRQRDMKMSGANSPVFNFSAAVDPDSYWVGEVVTPHIDEFKFDGRLGDSGIARGGAVDVDGAVPSTAVAMHRTCARVERLLRMLQPKNWEAAYGALHNLPGP